MGQQEIEAFLEKIEKVYAKIDEILAKAGDDGYLTRDKTKNILVAYESLEMDASFADAYKYLAFLQDIENFLKRFDKLKVEDFGTNLIDLCIDTSYASKDIAVMEAEGGVEWGEFIEITHDILKEYNNVIYHQAERFFEHAI
jgi:hypothetical protein